MHRRLSFLLGVLGIPANLLAFVGSVEVVPPRPTAADDIVVRVSGDLPTPCWDVQGGDVTVDGPEITVRIRMTERPGACIQVITPYDFETSIGKLSPGAYELTVVDAQDAKTVSFEVSDGAPLFPVRFSRADANADGKVDISDPISTLGVLFLGLGKIACDDAADINDDGKIDMSDAIYSLNYLFLFEEVKTIPAPGPRTCGADPTEDALGCDSFPPCSPASTGIYHVVATGIVCFTYPCPYWVATGEGTETQVHELDISPLGLSSEDAARVREELDRGQWKVRGYFLPGPEGPAGLGTTLVILELVERV